jgi:hypothetical protein
MSGFGCESVLSYEPRRNQWRRYQTPGLLSPRGILALDKSGFVAYASGQLAHMARQREPIMIDPAVSLASGKEMPFETVALSADGEGNVWAISAQGGDNGVGLATRIDRDKLQPSAQVLLGRGPRAAGDFSGIGAGGEFARSGSATHIFGGCGREGRETDGSGQALTEWRRLRVAAVSGAGAKVAISVRRAETESELEMVSFQPLGELPGSDAVLPLQLAVGGVLEVKLDLESAQAIGAPRVARVGVEWDCPGPD